LNVILISELTKEDYSKCDPSALEAMPKYQNVQMTDLQDLIATEEPAKTVNGDPPNNPLLNMFLPYDPSEEDYLKFEPSASEDMPKYRNVKTMDPQYLLASEVPNKTVNGDPPSDPFLNVFLPYKPSEEEYLKYDPSVSEAMPKIRMLR
jgi:hypothetical protein